MSNYVTTEGLPLDSQFGDKVDDPKNFRLQAKLPDSTATSLLVRLEVTRGVFAGGRVEQAIMGAYNYVLDKKDGDMVRGPFLRLVSDSVDCLERQTILVQLGDTITASYELSPGNRVEQKIQVGRPSSEDSNDADAPWYDDIRELKVRAVIIKDSNGNPCVTQAQVNQDISDANERLAQAGIRIRRVRADNGNTLEAEVVAAPAGFSGSFTGTFGQISLGSSDERSLMAYMDNDRNTLDVVYVPSIINTGYGDRAIAYYQSRNSTGNPSFGNWIVISATNAVGENAGGGKPNSLPHEIMHILLNLGHRMFGVIPLDPSSALFRGGTNPNKEVAGTKRIGPYPDAASRGVGQKDTTVMRAAAEALP